MDENDTAQKRTEAPEEAPLSPVEYITTATGTDMVLAGPLAQAFSEGLDTLYAKKEDGTSEAMENQAVDVGLARRHYIASKQPLLDQTNRSSMSLFYGVQKGTVQIKHIIDIVKRAASMNAQAVKRSAVVVDSYMRVIPGVGFRLEHQVALEAASVEANNTTHEALKYACWARNIPFYESFEEFLEKHN